MHNGPERVAIQVPYYVSNQFFFLINWWLSAWRTEWKTSGNNIKSLLKWCLLIEDLISSTNCEDEGEESNGLML